ncbi:uncharacterized protein LOC114515695 [Dendronephthya gigantea]|uniref:uncharacterized protein LOC114515695 n=1 Tax=Dendronephthya gigantea TaxID=151771 RepID=UPI00106BA39F|nr:uncharacterized protein LOC114515695 [Dendronephthya gigantea]
MNKAETSRQHTTGKRGPKAFDINTRVALGSLHAGIGETHMNNILSCINIPAINSNTFKQREREVGKAVEEIARQSCKEATNSIRNGIMTTTAELNENDLVSVPCSFDMGWQKRGKGHKQQVQYSTYTGDDDSTTEAHIRQKVEYKVEKRSDIVHMKRSLTTRLYNLKQNAKFPESSTLSTKVINYLVRCFSYAITQNKGNPNEIKKAVESIVPHAFGNHADCDISWCGYKGDLTNYKHKTLPYGKDLFGENLMNALNNIFNDYCTETVVNKIAPCSNSQRNEALNSVVG